MFNRQSNRTHLYAFYWNRQYRKYNAVQLTHIATKDPRRYHQANTGLIKAIRIKRLDPYAASGVKKTNSIADINGNLLNRNMGVTVVNRVSSSVANKIKQFGTDLYSRGRKLP